MEEERNFDSLEGSEEVEKEGEIDPDALEEALDDEEVFGDEIENWG
jgi:hypothetical protein